MKVKVEDKFIVIKIDDLTKHVSPSRRAMLSIILDDIQEGRKADGKKNNKYLVVNEDEKYAALVKKLILKEVSYLASKEIK